MVFGRGDPAQGVGRGDSSASVAERFRSVWTGDGDQATASVEMLPTRLAKACALILPVDAAGLSLPQTEFRVPIGASDETATLAEQLQFTQGDGPCIEAAHIRRSVTVGAREMIDRWPSFGEELFRHTPYRAIASLPVAITPHVFAALDLYLVDEARLAGLSHADVSAVTGQVSQALGSAAAASTQDAAPIQDDVEELLPIWLNAEPARDRTYVWVAMGMVMSQFRLTTADAIALLRSFAYGHDQLIDDIAADLVNGTLNIAELQP
jgi:hypothetical protein